MKTNRRHRVIALVAGVTVLLVLIAFWILRKPSPVIVVPLGRAVGDDGSQAYMFAVTNLTNRKLEVDIWRDRLTNSMNAGIGYTYRLSMPLGPMAGAWYYLYPPPKGVPWSVEVSCLRQPGKTEAKLRRLGARFRLCKDSPQWEPVQRIEIKE